MVDKLYFDRVVRTPLRYAEKGENKLVIYLYSNQESEINQCFENISAQFLLHICVSSS